MNESGKEIDNRRQSTMKSEERFDSGRFLCRLLRFITADTVDCIAGGRLNERELRKVYQAVQEMELDWEDKVEEFVQEAIASRHPYNETWEDRVS